jgi:hypothetical protein
MDKTNLPSESDPSTFARARAIYEMARDDGREAGLSDQEDELIYGACCKATDALFLTPAPDLSALSYKLEVFAAEDCHGLEPNLRDPLFAALVADARRLGGL